jgi:multiple sugar transport system ATP-binding protein
MADVIVRELYKRFGNVVAVNHINFDVKDMEFVVLLGPSGCGKTTTLRMIAGLETPDGGQVQIGGRDVTYLAPRDRNIGMVFERYALYPHLSVFENISYPLRVRKWHEQKVRERVHEIAEMLRITELIGRKVNQLSGGQMQRVAIGRAIIREASVFLLDEPISHLDAKLRSHMRGELKRLQKEIQSTTILVTHDQLEAMSMGDRIAVLNQGVIQQFDTPDRIFNLPANLFVANFVGEPGMNFLGCTLKREGEALRLEAPGLRVTVEEAWLKSSQAAINGGRAELVMGIRPEHVKLHSDRAGGGHSQYGEGKVYVVEPLGSEVIYDVEIGNKIVRIKVTEQEAKRLAVGMGDRVFVEFPSDSIYLFDKETEKTIAQAGFAHHEEKHQ